MKNKEKVIKIKLDLSKTQSLTFKDKDGTLNCGLELFRSGDVRFKHTDAKGGITSIQAKFNDVNQEWNLT